MHSLSAQMSSLLTGAFNYEHIITIKLLGTTIYLTDADTDREYRDVTFISGLIKKSEFSFVQNGELKSSAMDFDLVDTDNTLTSLILNGDLNTNSVLIERLYSNLNNEPVQVLGTWAGAISKPSEESSVVSIGTTDFWSLVASVAGRKTNNGSQQRFYPNDKCFEETPFAVRDIPWMRSAPPVNAGGTGGPTTRPTPLLNN